ncbi:TetR family transcriptional regulator [Actinoplanes lobatus]|uniref:AcrR family transcriptional regulator n=1 Tax=Actinoplanes lobatus TaxID=113568 RepID=A0A7W7HKE4_9ACTN|nr:TetR/AcrR family transcriptional regulator [Actinoplanes lobatus]MBB4752183.1 AcrR family transcriptional regulator [Actinoplanes lobatus]GGN83897.1 TetR family transcriptional regulator [Actinoplanes lobatus]GIE45445.1 TetR family transcriptional regulator [Actinoplanes lobatus]
MARGRGRPRASGEPASGLSTEQEIRAAAARLFCTQGYGSTSTYKIAKEARISQATMYHYFAGKHEILLALLLDTVRPSVAYAGELAASSEPAAARLWRLCAFDVRLLLSGEENLGSLYLLPELGDERFAPFHAERQRLFETYRDLVAAAGDLAGADLAAATNLVFGLVESVILRRRADTGVGPGIDTRIADAALRIAGLDEAAVGLARAVAQPL